jgi:prepilin-type processing-associated H-X9-DG protein
VLGSGFTESDRHDMPIFQCPSDAGYPAAFHTGAVPPSAYDTPCYDLFGNSYRANLLSVRDDTGAFSVGPWGHLASALPNPSKLVLFAEPLFYELISCGRAYADWHGRRGIGNVLFADGSARPTRTVENPPIDCTTGDTMSLPVCPPWCNKTLIRWGPQWSLDVWPTPGARIWGAAGLWTYPFEAEPFRCGPCWWELKCWPFLHYEDHLHVER